jgi:phosphoribosylglycinamide formyltransferase 1
VVNFAVFCSGQGTNLQAIINASKKKRVKSELALVVCDNPMAYALKRARRAGIETAIVDPKRFSTREKLEAEIIRNLDKKGIKLIVLAGFMRILSDGFVRKYRNRVINIHPALLPSFKGAHAIRDALRCGVKLTGATVHFVTEDVDGGPIILQEACGIKENDNEKSLLARVHKLEHKIYPVAIDIFARGKLKVAGKRVIIK